MQWINRRAMPILRKIVARRSYQILSDESLRAIGAAGVDYTKNALTFVRENKADSIVFSKDRAVQLYAFLESYFEQGKNNQGTLYVLYTYSSKEHEKSYHELQELYAGKAVVFVRENDFAAQLRQILHESTAATIGFFVDDMIFTHPVDYAHVVSLCAQGDTTVALTRGKDLVFSHVMQKPLTVPPLEPLGQGMVAFKWNTQKEVDDWNFPCGVSGYFYPRSLITAILDHTPFRSPNTLEMAIEVHNPMLKLMRGVCPERMACVCVHANLIQSEHVAVVLGTYSTKELLDYWNQGKKIELAPFYGSDGSQAQFFTYQFIDRK